MQESQKVGRAARVMCCDGPKKRVESSIFKALLLITADAFLFRKDSGTLLDVFAEA